MPGNEDEPLGNDADLVLLPTRVMATGLLSDVCHDTAAQHPMASTIQLRPRPIRWHHAELINPQGI